MSSHNMASFDLSPPDFNPRDTLIKSGHRSSFLRAEFDFSRPSSPVLSSPSPDPSSSADLPCEMCGVELPVEVVKRVLEELGKKCRKKVRLVSRAFERVVGASFLPTPVSGASAAKMVAGSSKYVSRIEELIVPWKLDAQLVQQLYSVRKLHFSEANLHFFNYLQSGDFPALRKVSFQGSAGLEMKENVPKHVEDVVFWHGAQPDYEISKPLLEDMMKNMEKLKSLEIWSERQYPEVLISKALRRVRLMGGVMASSMGYAIHQISNACPQLEELSITCRPLAAFNLPDHFDRASIMSFAHPTLTKLRILHSWAKPISFAMPQLLRLTLEAPQHHFIALSKAPLLHKLTLTASPTIASNIFLRPPPALTSCTLTICSGLSPKISKTRANQLQHMAALARPPSVPSLSSGHSNSDDEEPLNRPQGAGNVSPRSVVSSAVPISSVNRSHARSSSISISTQNSAKNLRMSTDDIAVSPHQNSLDDSSPESPPSIVSAQQQRGHSGVGAGSVAATGTSPTSPSSRRKVVQTASNRHSSTRHNDICISISSKTLKKCDLRVQTMEDSFPRIRRLTLDAQNLEDLIFQIHPHAVAPNDIQLFTPSLRTFSTSMHPSLTTELFPNFEKFGKLRKLFVTLQDEDIAAMAPAMAPYMHWQLGHISALGLSNISILKDITIESKFLRELVLENMHSFPFHLMENLDQYLPFLNHLEIKAPEQDDLFDDESNEPHPPTSSSADSHKASSSEIDEDNPYFMQKEYRNLCPQSRVRIRSNSLRSLIYSVELPHHPILELPQLRDLLYLQMDTTETLDLKQTLTLLPKLETAYIGVARLSNCQLLHKDASKLKLVFGFADGMWNLKAPKLNKLKLIRILESPNPLDLSLARAHVPILKHLDLVGVVLDEQSCNILPDSTFVRISTMDVDL